MNRYTLISLVVIILTLVCSENSLLAQGNQVQPDSVAPDGTPIYKYIQQMPQAPFNVAKYLSKNIEYPMEARLKNIEGKVVVGFRILETGDIDSVYIIKGVGAGCDEEAMRVVNNMPRWLPGKARRASGGKWKKVKVYYTLPINFKLKD